MTFEDHGTTHTFQSLRHAEMEAFIEKKCHYIHGSSMFLQLISTIRPKTKTVILQPLQIFEFKKV